MRDHRAAAYRINLYCLICLLVFGGGYAGAQQGGGRLRGVVTDSAGTPIGDADVGILALHKLTKTDDKGRFTLERVPVGEVSLSVRRLGFEPATLVLQNWTDPIEITLQAHVPTLTRVDVQERDLRRLFWIEDFYRRRMRGIGTYVSREDIEGRHSTRTSDMFRNIPGIRFVPGQGGMGVRFVSAAVQRRDCIPMIWLDGQRAPGMEVDEIPITNVEGIELYHGPATTPVRFSQSHGARTSCGTIVIWTRVPGT